MASPIPHTDIDTGWLDNLLEAVFSAGRIAAGETVAETVNKGAYIAIVPDEAKKDVTAHITKAVADAETNAVAWVISVLDMLHGGAVPDLDRVYKGIKNTIRDRYKAETGVDPTPNYPVKAELKRKERPNE